MKRPVISIKAMSVFLVLICFLFSACQQSVATDNSALSSSVSSSETSYSGETVSDDTTPAINYANIVYALPNAEKTSTLDFLPEKLQALYQEAKDAYYPMHYSPDSLVNLYQYESLDDMTVEIDGDTFKLFATSFDEYKALLRQIFTERALMSIRFYENFTSYNGYLAGRQRPIAGELDYSYVYVNDYYPDEYIPGEATDSYIAFTLVAYYDYKGGTKPEDMAVYSVKYPILLVKTADGWRFDVFHTELFG
jgi:hypothetical protein